jgi:hypothetical protein
LISINNKASLIVAWDAKSLDLNIFKIKTSFKKVKTLKDLLYKIVFSFFSNSFLITSYLNHYTKLLVSHVAKRAISES